MTVPVKTGRAFEFGQPSPLFQTTLTVPGNTTFSRYDVTADGQRFLMIVPALSPTGGASSAPITTVVNFTAALNKK